MKQKNIFNLFSQKQLIQMNQKQQQFAQQQFRKIYSRMQAQFNQDQMSKISSKLAKKEDLQSRINQIQQQKQSKLKQQMKRLEQKMKQVELKRKQYMQLRVNSSRFNQEKHRRKLFQIQEKMKQLSEEAENKIKAYNKEFESYIEIKKNQFSSQRNIKNSNSVGSIIPLTLSVAVIKPTPKKNKLILPKKTEVDKLVAQHQIKSQLLRNQKQGIIFQKVLKKLQKIKNRRQNLAQLSKRNIQINISKTPKHIRTQTQQLKNYKNVNIEEKSKYGSVSMLQPHYSRKAQIQFNEREFIKRGQMWQSNIQKKNKQKILKKIKQKVIELKILAQRKN